MREENFLDWCEQHGVLFSFSNLRDGSFQLLLWPIDNRHGGWQRDIKSDLVKVVYASANGVRGAAVSALESRGVK